MWQNWRWLVMMPIEIATVKSRVKIWAHIMDNLVNTHINDPSTDTSSNNNNNKYEQQHNPALETARRAHKKNVMDLPSTIHSRKYKIANPKHIYAIWLTFACNFFVFRFFVCFSRFFSCKMTHARKKSNVKKLGSFFCVCWFWQVCCALRGTTTSFFFLVGDDGSSTSLTSIYYHSRLYPYR